MDLRFHVSLFLAKILQFILIKTNRGATAAPGLLGLKFDKLLLQKLAKNLSTVILVTGTNGKTTTSRLVADHLQNLDLKFVHNRHGSNLERGIVSAFLNQTKLNGELKAEIGLFEVDEAALVTILPKVAPKVLVITNLFRDQLDRYGEVDNIRRAWRKCLENLDATTTLVLNADDPSLAFLGENLRCKVVYFGLDDQKQLRSKLPLAVDNIACPNCGFELNYQGYFISHQGHYKCVHCEFKRPKPEIVGSNIKLSDKKIEFELVAENKINLDLELNLPGLYNIYNCLSTFAAISAAGFNLDSFPLTTKKFTAVFGRAEKVTHDGRDIIVALAKNPTGFGEILETYLTKSEKQTALILINDKIADGRDVSWLWDVNFEDIAQYNHRFITSGLRGSDMALRLKYAGITTCENMAGIEAALEKGLSMIPQNDTLLIIPTYTAMLELKKIFVHKGISGQFWED